MLDCLRACSRCGAIWAPKAQELAVAELLCPCCVQMPALAEISEKGQLELFGGIPSPGSQVVAGLAVPPGEEGGLAPDLSEEVKS